MPHEKGYPGGECYRTVCKNTPAVGFNRSTGTWYCRECSERLNKENYTEAMDIYGGLLVVIPPGHDAA